MFKCVGMNYEVERKGKLIIRVQKTGMDIKGCFKFQSFYSRLSFNMLMRTKRHSLRESLKNILPTLVLVRIGTCLSNPVHL